MPVEVFDGRDAARNDDADRARTAARPRGYVINTNRNINPGYRALHRSWCGDVTNQARYEPGIYTERQYAQVCADSRAEFVEWVRQDGRPDGSFTSEGCRCHRRRFRPPLPSRAEIG
jgi:hypothetical protein